MFSILTYKWVEGANLEFWSWADFRDELSHSFLFRESVKNLFQDL